jgi:formylglycine-generating enzyme required for sulfatase activity
MQSKSTASHSFSQAELRVLDFESQYGFETLALACHAAFPLTLTSELVYCLRETFVPGCPWYGSADLLLSGLCNPVGYDLYDIENPTRKALLQRLQQDFGDNRLDDLQNFMVAYIEQQLKQERPVRVRMLGDKPHWTALACLRPNEAFQRIQTELQRHADLGEPNERFHWAALLESYGDFLPDFQPILVKWSQQTARGEPINPEAEIISAMEVAGFPPLKSLTIEVQTIVFTDDIAQGDNDTLTPFTFETVAVDRRGGITQKSPHTAYRFTETLPQGINLEMVAIPSGEFLMGSPETEHQHQRDESPQHKVTVPPFFMGKYPITQGQWSVVSELRQIKRPIETDPSRFKGKDLPVERVSWLDAEEFCLRLSEATGRTYRLPSEAEWEYACRAGTRTPFYFGETITGKLANYDSDYNYLQESKIKSRGQTSPVGEYPPNGFGLYDMHGNVWEWCLDHWHDKYDGAPNDGSSWLTDNDNASCVLRGGSWDLNPWWCRSAFRYYGTPGFRFNVMGFRVVCDSPRTL